MGIAQQRGGGQGGEGKACAVPSCSWRLHCWLVLEAYVVRSSCGTQEAPAQRTCAAFSWQQGNKLSATGFWRSSGWLQGSRCMLWIVDLGGLYVRVCTKLSGFGCLVSSCAMKGVFLYVSIMPSPNPVYLQQEVQMTQFLNMQAAGPGRSCQGNCAVLCCCCPVRRVAAAVSVLGSASTQGGCQ
jgi:hypothetical protein